VERSGTEYLRTHRDDASGALAELDKKLDNIQKVLKNHVMAEIK
jgi:hypothetical protein